MERFTTYISLLLAKYHHSHSSFSLSYSLVIVHCYKMPKCLQDLCIHLFTRSLHLNIMMNPIMPPTPSFIDRQLAHITYSTSVCFVLRPAGSVVKVVCDKQLQLYDSINLLSNYIQLYISTVFNRYQDDSYG